MLTTEAATPLRFPVRRDRWDTVDYYLWFYVLLAAGGMCCSAFATLQISGGNRAAWGPLIYSLFAFGMGVKATINKTWQRFAEEYILTSDALILEYGYRRLRIPYDQIVAVHPIKVCRATTALKPAHRINFRKPIGMERAADAYPLNSEGFLEELAMRCPHLTREGERMWMHSAGGREMQTTER